MKLNAALIGDMPADEAPVPLGERGMTATTSATCRRGMHCNNPRTSPLDQSGGLCCPM